MNDMNLKEIYKYAIEGITHEANRLVARCGIEPENRETIIDEINTLGKKVELLQALIKYA